METNSDNPLSVDRIKLSEKLQSLSPIQRLLIPEEFSQLAISYLNKNSPDLVSKSEDNPIRNKNAAIGNSQILENTENIPADKLVFVPQDFIMPPASDYTLESVSKQGVGETSLGKIENMKETKIETSSSNPLASKLNRVEDLEGWLDEFL